MKALSIAISGCGAVVNQYYGPLLRRRERDGCIRVIGIHDPSQDQMTRAAQRYFPNASRCENYQDLVKLAADLMIIASPPASHPDQAVAALAAGRAVLCEKPMALSVRDAERMITAAKRTGSLLAVAMVRRLHPASRITKRVLHERLFGAPLSIEIFEGGAFRWPIADPSYFKEAVSGGGVLADLGPHVLDLLRDWLGTLELVQAHDDAMGGVEANALLRLLSGQVSISIRLSRDWPRPNGVTVRLERALLRWQTDEYGHVIIQTDDDQRLQLSDPQGGVEFLDSFDAQIDAVLDRLAGGPANVVTGPDALEVVRVIEHAYRIRQRMSMPWLEPDHGHC